MYTLKDAIEEEAFTVIIDPQPGLREDKIDLSHNCPVIGRWAQLCQRNTIAIAKNHWTCARAAAQELSKAYEWDSNKLDEYTGYLLHKWLVKLEESTR